MKTLRNTILFILAFIFTEVTGILASIGVQSYFKPENEMDQTMGKFCILLSCMSAVVISATLVSWARQRRNQKPLFER